MKNVVVLPTELMISDSYTISMWLNVAEYNRWSSAFFVRYQKKKESYNLLAFCYQLTTNYVIPFY